MPNTELEVRAQLASARAAVDAAATRHGRLVADAVGDCASTANGLAKTVVFGVALAARYIVGFAQELRRAPNA
jgi:hypothetical protein